MGSHTVALNMSCPCTEMSAWWWLLVTETCSRFSLLNILFCFDWTTFYLVLQHNGMSPTNLESATLVTCTWEVPGSNLEHGTGYKVTSQGFVNLHCPSRKTYSSQSTQPVPSKFLSFLSATVHSFDNIKCRIQHIKMN